MTDHHDPEASRRYETEVQQGEAMVHGREVVWGWTGEAGQRRADRRAAFLVEAARLGPGVRCLELGCGTGEFSVRLAESGCDLTAIELSDATAAVCRERVGNRAEVLVGNIETGEGLDGREFDAIVGVSVLHHVDLGRTFAATMSRLRSGGRFAFTEPNMSNPQVWAERHIGLVARRRHVLPHETAFRLGELRSIFEQAGFVVDESEPFDFLHPHTPAGLIGLVERAGRWIETTPLRHLAGSLTIAGHRPGPVQDVRPTN
jgi:cyclopropane fatty-acyl-phospholipid synthase-like methyltransferase